jgi:LuxR family maltose regulon positive regulatory protein
MAEASGPLLATKLYIPPQRPNLVLRPRLMDCLEGALDRRCRMTLVSSKAGSGKTTLVSEWVHRQARPAAQAALDHAGLPAIRAAAQDARFRQAPYGELFIGLLAGPNAGPFGAELNRALNGVEEQVLHEGADAVTMLEEAGTELALEGVHTVVGGVVP